MNKIKPLLKNLIIATKNDGKLQEMIVSLSDIIPSILTHKNVNWDTPEETGQSFAENSIIKARHVAITTGFPALADDSGLCIEKLNDAPSIFSARLAEEHQGFDGAIAQLNKELKGQESRAKFISVLCLYLPDGTHYEFSGTLYGNIKFPPQGPTIGYESIFIPDGHDTALSALAPSIREKIHYRTLAIEKFKAFIKNDFYQ